MSMVNMSSSSGYLTAIYNVHSNSSTVRRTVSVPAGHVIMVSFKRFYKNGWNPELASCLVLKLYVYDANRRHIKFYDHDENFDQVEVYKTASLTLSVSSFHRQFLLKKSNYSRCFEIFFSIHYKSEVPQTLPSGLFNCSVGHYSTYQHHLDCNMRTECEGRQDETEYCPFSSPDCQGLVALCKKCYKYISSLDLREFRSNETKYYYKAREYCHFLGGVLAVPLCENDWYEAFFKFAKPYMHILKGLALGLYSADMSLANIYRRTILNDKMTVLYHSFQAEAITGHRSSVKICFSNFHREAIWGTCENEENPYSAICEFKTTNTSRKPYKPDAIRLASPQLLLHIKQQSLTRCPDGHVTHAFLLCGSHQYDVCSQGHKTPCTFSGNLSLTHNRFDLTDQHAIPAPLFTCGDDLTTLSYTLVCDFRPDCPDKSDESFCEHPPCVNMFTCVSGQCVSFDKRCDMLFECQDQSDEEDCGRLRGRYTWYSQYIPSPVLVNFDGISSFISTPMKSNESCPDTHYRCPGEYNDCLPVYTRCNEMYDCMGHEDEEECEDMVCPGFFRCRSYRICVHGDHLCDDWPHCPLHDDELLCGVTCPAECLCHDHTFLCFQPFSASLFPQLRFLDATGSGMSLSVVSTLAYLIRLILSQCSLSILSDMNLFNLQFLDVSGNKLHHVNMTNFLNLLNLQILSMSKNPLISLYTDDSSFLHQTSLRMIDLSHTTLTVFDTTVLSKFSSLQKLNLTFTTIHTISNVGFQYTPQLSQLYMDGSPVKTFPSDIFKDLTQLSVVSTGNYKLCCHEMLPHTFERKFCYAPEDEISSCEDLLQSGMYRVFLWPVSCLSLTGNVFCFVVRLCAWKTTSLSGFNVFVINLTVADFLMGVYIVIIGVADELFRGIYLHYDETWTSSVACKMAGFLSLLSSEVSAVVIWLITLDRFIVLRFPFSTLRFGKISASMACMLTWMVGWFLALLPLLPVTAHWEFYSQTGICIPLPVTRRDFKGRFYSVSVLIVFNFILFVMISAGQAFIYWSVQKNTMTSSTSKVSRDLTIARRLITVAVTDFMCWFPIGLCGFLALAGIPIPGEVNVALAIFVLPLNSAINPFMYTFNILAEKQRKSQEAKLLKWLESHIELLDS